ncbi:MAG: ABC transporter substrate-binding protein [Desulfosalsimonas sp.]
MRLEFSIKAIIIAVILVMAETAPVSAYEFSIGTWKTAQTIAPFYYSDYIPDKDTVDVYPFSNPADQKNALLAGSLDMCGTTIAHAIHSASMGQPVVIVAALCNKCSALVVKKDAGIENISDLKGKKIGYVPGTMHEILLRETLGRKGLSVRDDVSLVRIDFFDMGQALSQGNIDAFLSGEPFPSMAVKNGYGEILAHPYYDEDIGDINAGMLVTRDFMQKHPEKVRKLVTAHARATLYLERHPDQWLNRASDFGTSVSVLQEAAPNMELTWDMDEVFVSQVKALGERMHAMGMIRRQPDYEDLIDLSFVQQVRRKIIADE